MTENLSRSTGKQNPLEAPSWPFMKQGWLDMAAGRGFPPQYDSWSRLQQTRYERGHIWALCVKMELGIYTAPPTELTHSLLATLGEDYFRMQNEAIKAREDRAAAQRAQLAEYGICEVY